MENKSHIRFVGIDKDTAEEVSTIETDKFVISVRDRKGSPHIEIKPLSGSSILSRMEGILYSLFRSTPPTHIPLNRAQGRSLMNAIRRIVEKNSQRPLSKR